MASLPNVYTGGIVSSTPSQQETHSKWVKMQPGVIMSASTRVHIETELERSSRYLPARLAERNGPKFDDPYLPLGGGKPSLAEWKQLYCPVETNTCTKISITAEQPRTIIINPLRRVARVFGRGIAEQYQIDSDDDIFDNPNIKERNTGYNVPESKSISPKCGKQNIDDILQMNRKMLLKSTKLLPLKQDIITQEVKIYDRRISSSIGKDHKGLELGSTMYKARECWKNTKNCERNKSRLLFGRFSY